PDDLRGPVPPKPDHRPFAGTRGRADRDPRVRRGRRCRHLPPCDPLLAVLERLERLPRPEPGRDDRLACPGRRHGGAPFPRKRASGTDGVRGRAAADLRPLENLDDRAQRVVDDRRCAVTEPEVELTEPGDAVARALIDVLGTPAVHLRTRPAVDVAAEPRLEV